MKRLFSFALIGTLYAAIPSLFAQSAATSLPTPTLQQPCGTIPTTGKPAIKVPPKWRARFDQISPISSSDLAGITNTGSGKSSTPCPPASQSVPNTQLVPAQLPAGVTTVWSCEPLTGNPIAGTSMYVMPEDIPIAAPNQAGQFMANSAKAVAHAPTPCSSLRRDPTSGRVWLFTK